MFDIPIIYIFIAAFLLILFFLFIAFLKKEKFPYYSRETLLTPAELKFFHVLRSVVREKYAIAPKVRLADIINCDDRDWKKGYGPKISSKHIDFVLYDPEDARILLTIELDDKSHNLPHRRKRDAFVNKALKTSNIPLLRVPVQKGYDLAALDKEMRIFL
ncbi:MAG: DUF2726 domain-containing protein [Pseudomonadota bacterium]